MSEIKIIRCPLIPAAHGFSTRSGGVSAAPFDSLNLGGTEDVQAHIDENRRRFIRALGFDPNRVARLHQVHGADVLIAKPGRQTGDALVTNERGLALAVGAADCYPLLFHDPVANVAGAAHAGWRGTLARIAKNTVEKMITLGADAKNIRVAIGPGICRKNYEVSEEVIAQFVAAGFPERCWTKRQLDLLEANRFVLRESGILAEHTWALDRCTTEADFFSYRRDKGRTGRMWGVIGL